MVPQVFVKRWSVLKNKKNLNCQHWSFLTSVVLWKHARNKVDLDNFSHCWHAGTPQIVQRWIAFSPASDCHCSHTCLKIWNSQASFLLVTPLSPQTTGTKDQEEAQLQTTATMTDVRHLKKNMSSAAWHGCVRERLRSWTFCGMMEYRWQEVSERDFSNKLFKRKQRPGCCTLEASDKWC